MKLLALDASTEALSVALFDSARPAAAVEHFEIAPRAHATVLLPVAQRLLDDAGWQLATLDGIAFGCGPGAFTGLRIAAGFVQGLAYGADLPVAPVSTLAAVAARALERHAGRRVRVVQDARMGEVYTADFAGTDAGPQVLAEQRVVPPTAVAAGACDSEWLFAGNGWQVLAEACGQAAPAECKQWPHAQDIARLGAGLLQRGQGVTPDQALPVYVRDDVARKAQR